MVKIWDRLTYKQTHSGDYRVAPATKNGRFLNPESHFFLYQNFEIYRSTCDYFLSFGAFWLRYGLFLSSKYKYLRASVFHVCFRCTNLWAPRMSKSCYHQSTSNVLLYKVSGRNIFTKVFLY